MKEEDRVRALRATFRGELSETVPVLDHKLEALGQATSQAVRAELVADLLRGMHSLKGAASSARVVPIAHACHLVEDVLLGLRDPELAPVERDRRIALLDATIGALRATADTTEDAASGDRGPLDDLLPLLEEAARREAPPARPTRTGQAVTASAFETLCSELARTAAEHADSEGKRVDFRLEGAPWRIDDTLTRHLRDPLRHLVRNAVKHGIESPEIRAARGKPERGHITIEAIPGGTATEVSVTDDGAGLDLDALALAARRHGLQPPSQPRDIAELAFVLGLSTLGHADEIAGRGLGLDAARCALTAAGGTLTVATEPGIGCRFTLTIPITPRVTAVALVASDGRTFALDRSAVESTLELRQRDVRWVLGRPCIVIGGRVAAVASLEDLLGGGAPRNWQGPAVLLCDGDRRVVLLVEAITDPLRLAASWRRLGSLSGLRDGLHFVLRLLRNAPLELPADTRLQAVSAHLRVPYLEGVISLPGEEIVWMLSAPALVHEISTPTVPATDPRGERP